MNSMSSTQPSSKSSITKTDIGISTPGRMMLFSKRFMHLFCESRCPQGPRLPLSPFFSKAKVVSRQYLIRRNIDKLCDRISRFVGLETTVNLGAATSAFTQDISSEFILGKSYNSLDRKDFDIGMTNVFQGAGISGG